MTETPQADLKSGPDPDTFDLDSWLEGVQMLKAVVTLYARGDLATRIDEIVSELEPITERVNNHKVAAGDSLADAGVDLRADTKRRDELRTELRDLWAEYEASGADFELTQISSSRYDDLVDAVEALHPEPAFDAPEAEQVKVGMLRDAAGAVEMLLASVTAVGPHGKPRTPMTLTREKLTQVEERFGVEQFGRLVGQARRLSIESRVDSPFSQRVSAALGESTSD